MRFIRDIWEKLKALGYIRDSMDPQAATQTIRANIPFKGPNVWILSFAIIIASVGLNINSTAVIIGAMLISPLMGPIFGLGLALGTNDIPMLRHSAKNLLVMVAVSLLASALYFLVSPLNLVNPTELESRTNPTIYDLLIALFGGAAGIFEMCRREKGTVLSGVAIATALMPPICTAGYGLANANMHFFFGALYLFTINTIFITLSTYLMVKYLKFPVCAQMDSAESLRNRRIITAVVIIVAIPSLISAIDVIRANNFKNKAIEFVARNKTLERSYVYDYGIDDREKTVELFIGGEQLNPYEKDRLREAARDAGLNPDKVIFKERLMDDNGKTSAESERLMQGIYARTDNEINKREAQIRLLEGQLREMKNAEIPYTQIYNEVKSQYPYLKDIYLARGAKVQQDSVTREQRCIVMITVSGKSMPETDREKLESWLKIRLSDTSAVVLNHAASHPVRK